METLFQMFIPLYIYKYSRHKSHIQSKSLRKNAPCIIVRKVKLLFEATQFNKKKKMFHSFTCVIPPNSQCIRKCITRQDNQKEHVLYRKQKVKTVSF